MSPLSPGSLASSPQPPSPEFTRSPPQAAASEAGKLSACGSPCWLQPALHQCTYFAQTLHEASRRPSCVSQATAPGSWGGGGVSYLFVCLFERWRVCHVAQTGLKLRPLWPLPPLHWDCRHGPLWPAWVGFLDSPGFGEGAPAPCSLVPDEGCHWEEVEEQVEGLAGRWRLLLAAASSVGGASAPRWLFLTRTDPSPPHR